jgi:putative iron-regulated protein
MNLFSLKRVTAAMTLSGGVWLSLASGAAWAVSPQEVVVQYANVVQANYDDTLDAAKKLQEAIKVFTAAPSKEGLDAARKAWLNAREAYGQTEAFRFYSGPIDDKNGPEGRINSWPMDESFVDGVKGKENSGLINDKKFKITKASLSKMNERGGEENIATGWHAIEFLLWGQDLNENGPGDRNFEDYVDGKTPNADRRRQYLTVVTDLLIDDLTTLTKAWAPGPGVKNYRVKFEKGGIDSLQKIMVGMGSLSRGELAGERMEVPLASQDQEDEHSCFSDNTHRDIVNNALGIQNVWLGHYKKLDGTVVEGVSLRDFVAEKNSQAADKLTQQLAKSVESAEAIHAPFDREIVGAKDAPGRLRVQATVDSLVQQSKYIVEAASAIGVKQLPLVKPKP